MIKATDILDLMEVNKPSFGTVEGFNYVVNIETLDSNEFYKQPFGRQMDDWKKIKDWKSGAKTAYVDAKGKATMASVKRWVKENKPKEFFTRWKADSSSYKDDSVEIYYKK